MSASIFVTVLLLVLQLWTLQYILEWVEGVDGGADVERAKRFVHRFGLFLEMATSHGVPLFLTDKDVLDKIDQTEIGHRSFCAFFCTANSIQLATVAQLSSQSQRDALMKNALKLEGAKVSVSSGNDPSLLHHGLEVKIPFHYFVEALPGKVIHVAVLYERAGKSWWRGAVQKSLRDDHRLGKELSYEVLYKKVEVQAAVVDGVKVFLPVPISSFTDQKFRDTRFKECNFTNAQRFFDQYGKDQSSQAEEFQKKAWKLLSKASRLLDKLGVPFWLSSGTCLGFFRQCSIIPYSQDVDIGIWVKDYRDEIVSTFSTHDIPLTHLFGHPGDSLELSFRDGDVKLDIFFFYQDENYVWNGGTQARTGRKFKYIFPKFNLCWTEFLELLVRVPCETESYIRANYGHNWFEPLKVWDWKKNPANVEENGVWPVDQWPEVIQLIPLPEQ